MAQGSAGPAWLDEKLRSGATVIIDGAMGTELEARGVPMHEKCWSAQALLAHGAVVRDAHIDYIHAGAEVIITNTFSTGRHMMEPAGFGDEVTAVNRRAVALAREAVETAGAEHPVAIAGSICEWVPAKESGWLAPAHHRAALAEQADLLAEAGVDFIALEMCMRLDETLLALEAALATGLPVWAGLSCRRDPQSGALVTFDPPHYDFDELAREVARHKVGLVAVMHSPIADSAAGIDALRAHWDGPVGVYPESGHFIMPNWQFVDIIDPAGLVAEAQVWRDRGVQVFGGCCGLGPAHVRALRQALSAGEG